MAEELVDVGNGITLCYETFGDPGDPTLLLIMGLGTQMIGWPEELCELLAERGLHVVRFDNRDTGLSTHLRGRPPSVAQLIHRRFGPDQYRLEDMARDAAGLLRALDLAPAHVVGASMGGMIAQVLATEHPECVRSLISIMSSTGHRFSGQPALGIYRYFLSPSPADRDAYIEHMVRLFRTIGSTGFPQDLDDVRERAGRAFDRNRDPAATGRQLGAILASGDRTLALRSVRAPTLVIHGTADRMVTPSGGRATARAIADAELMMVDGMGHDLPRALWPRIVDAIAGHAARADRVAQPV